MPRSQCTTARLRVVRAGTYCSSRVGIYQGYLGRSRLWPLGRYLLPTSTSTKFILSPAARATTAVSMYNTRRSTDRRASTNRQRYSSSSCPVLVAFAPTELVHAESHIFGSGEDRAVVQLRLAINAAHRCAGIGVGVGTPRLRSYLA